MIRPMTPQDAPRVLDMMRIFYASPAVLSNGSEEIFQNDVAECVSDSPYLEGHVFEENGQLQGYAMVAKSFSTEFGKRCIWIEDLYVQPQFRGLGLGGGFLQHIQTLYPGALFRLEAERENEGAVRLYEKMGFETEPRYFEDRNDIITSIAAENAENLDKNAPAEVDYKVGPTGDEEPMVGVIPERKPYHERYYLLFGDVNEPFCIDQKATKSYLDALGFGFNPLSQAREGKNISKITGFAFDGYKSLIDVQIEKTVTQIDTYAFKGCPSLTTLWT